MRTWPMLLSAFALAAPGLATAQIIPGSSPTALQCQAAAAALAGGDRNSMNWHDLSRCGASGAQALGQALQEARNEIDAEYLYMIYSAAGAVRDPEILAAAADLTRDHGAAVPARVTAVLVLANQVVPGFAYSPSIAWSDLLTLPQSCRTTDLSYLGYTFQRQLQADSTSLVADALDQVRRDESEGPLLRSIATCVRQHLMAWVPVTVSPSVIGLSYICGNQFRLENGSDEHIVASFEVVGTADRGDLPVGAWQNLYFTTWGPGTLRLFYLGQVIREVANGGTPCPS